MRGMAMAAWPHIDLAREMNLSYVYLGYWIEGSRNMHYKSRFRPLELLGPQGWRDYQGTADTG